MQSLKRKRLFRIECFDYYEGGRDVILGHVFLLSDEISRLTFGIDIYVVGGWKKIGMKGRRRGGAF